ncbi:MAG: zinc-ribbon domain-containing protein [Faecousia sp.]
MAFWNDPKKITGKGPNKLAETPASRLAALMEGVEQQKNEICRQIGQTYVKLHPVDYEEPFADMMKAMDQANGKLDALALQRQRMNGVITCPNCGNECSSDSRFCNQCGLELPRISMDRFVKCRVCGELVVKELDTCLFCGSDLHAPAGQVLRCSRCGEAVEPGNRFCQYCGELILQPSDGSEAGKHPSAPGKRICPNPKCGAVMEADVQYCTECGTKL